MRIYHLCLCTLEHSTCFDVFVGKMQAFLNILFKFSVIVPNLFRKLPRNAAAVYGVSAASRGVSAAVRGVSAAFRGTEIVDYFLLEL